MKMKNFEIKYINDKLIKKVLGSEQREIRNYVARIISHTTGIPLEELKDNLELIHPEIGSNVNVINSIGDIPLHDNKRYFGLEINYSRSATSKIKSITYLFQLTLRQVTHFSKYSQIKPVTIININARDVYHEGWFVYETVFMEKNLHKQYNDLFTIYDINLSYFKNIPYNKIEEGLLKDLALFVIEDEEFFNKLYKEDREIKMVKENIKNYTALFDEMFYCSEEELQRQIDEEMKEEGIKEGREVGHKEKAREIAKKMLAKNKDIEEIQELTDLTKEEIEELKE